MRVERLDSVLERCESMPSLIEDYAVIGNCETLALVGRDGSTPITNRGFSATKPTIATVWKTNPTSPASAGAPIRYFLRHAGRQRHVDRIPVLSEGSFQIIATKGEVICYCVSSGSPA